VSFTATELHRGPEFSSFLHDPNSTGKHLIVQRSKLCSSLVHARNDATAGMPIKMVGT
jgi:hypothetical protein